MYGFDSLSKNAFIRKLPKTYEFLTQHLNGDILQGYNIVGDGTPQALIPILTGFTELELPETRKRMKDSKSVNVYPMIWSEYERSGYVTAFNEDVPSIGTFSYRLNGFDKQPTGSQSHTPYSESSLKFFVLNLQTIICGHTTWPLIRNYKIIENCVSVSSPDIKLCWTTRKRYVHCII